MKQYLIGLDNGGTVSKAALFDLRGNEMARATAQTPVYSPKPGYAERDMEELWQANCQVVRQVLEKAHVSPQAVIGVGICGHGKGLYPWGVAGPVGNGIVSTDRRAWKYPKRWQEDGTFDKLYPDLCQQIVPGQQACLLAWLKDHKREMYDNIRWVFAVKDYIRFRLTGEAYSEVTDLSGSGLMDVRHGRVSGELLRQLGIAEVEEKIPPLKLSTDLCGAITPEAAASTGLAVGTPVAGGMFDIDACAIAMGITDEGPICTITGTWSINEFLSKTPVLHTAIAMNSLFAIPDYYLIEECSPTSAGNLDWCLDQLMEDVPLPEGMNRYQLADRLAEGIAPGDSDVYYLPFLYGSNVHPLARACFLGFTSYHTKAHMLRAVFEGVAFSAKSHVEKLLSVREKPGTVRLAGGVVNSPFWAQMFADVLNLPVETVVGVKELGALGGAIAAAVAAGVFPDYPAAVAQMVRVNPLIHPDAASSAVYAKKYRKYLAFRDALDPVWSAFEE